MAGIVAGDAAGRKAQAAKQRQFYRLISVEPGQKQLLVLGLQQRMPQDSSGQKAAGQGEIVVQQRIVQKHFLQLQADFPPGDGVPQILEGQIIHETHPLRDLGAVVAHALRDFPGAALQSFHQVALAQDFQINLLKVVKPDLPGGKGGHLVSPLSGLAGHLPKQMGFAAAGAPCHKFDFASAFLNIFLQIFFSPELS